MIARGGTTLFGANYTSSNNMNASRTIWNPIQLNRHDPNYVDLPATGPNNARVWGLGASVSNGHNAGYDGLFPGGGGVGFINSTNSTYQYGNGASGVVILQGYNPNKDKENLENS